MTTLSLLHTVNPVTCVLPLSAVWYVGLTEEASEAWFAGTGVAVDIVCTRASVLAGAALALIHLSCASCPCEAWQTAAAV